MTEEHGDDCIVEIIRINGIVKKISSLMNHKEMVVAWPTLRTIGNILASPYLGTAIEAGVLNKVAALFDHPDDTIKSELCWVIGLANLDNHE